MKLALGNECPLINLSFKEKKARQFAILGFGISLGLL